MGGDLYLKNGHIVDALNGRCYPEGTGVFIRDGVIAGLPGLPGEPEPPGSCRTIDLKGRYAIPALFNTHCHLQLISGLLGHKELRRRQIEKSLRDCVEYGITNIRDAWAPDLSYNRDFTGRINSGSLIGPRVQQCVAVCPEGNFCAPKQTAFNRMLMPLVDYCLPHSGTVAFKPDASAREVRDAVDRAIDERGADCIKFYDQIERFIDLKPGGANMTDEQLAAAADQARKRGIPVTAHHTKRTAFLRNIACGVKSIAHTSGNAVLKDGDIAAFMDSGAYIEPTLSVSYGLGWSSLHEDYGEDPDICAMEALRKETFEEMTRRFWLPEMAAVFMKNFNNYTKGNFRVLGIIDMSAPMRRSTKGIPTIAENVRRLYAAGGRDHFAAGNDATVAFYTQAAIQIEFLMLKTYLERGGIKPDPADILRIATIQSAHAMGLGDRFGTIEKGKTADIVVYDGNPLEDMGIIGGKTAAVFKDGKLVADHCGLAA